MRYLSNLVELSTKLSSYKPIYIEGAMSKIMKLCWDNIENLRLTKGSMFKDVIKNKYYYYHESCSTCGDTFFAKNKDQNNCSKRCSNSGENNPMYDVIHTDEYKQQMSENCKGRIISEETKKKMSESQKGRIFTEEHKQKISESLKGENHPNYGKYRSEETKLKLSELLGGENHYLFGKHLSEETKKKMSESHINRTGGYNNKGIPLYDTFAPQIEWCEEVRRNKEEPNILEVKCFKCGKWYIPNLINVKNRSQILKGIKRGEYHFYCSDECKHSCSIYGKKPETIMKEDAVRAGRLSWLELGREVQSELRKIVLERDEGKCIYCGSTDNIQCHHIYPVNIEPLLSADVDNCMTLCYTCHKKVHKKDGCRLNQLHIEEC